MKKFFRLFGIVTLSFVNFVLYAQVPTSGLLHRFQFNNYSLQNEAETTQFSGTGGVAVGTATNRHGHPNSAALVSSYVRAVNSTPVVGPTGANARTFSLWVNPQTVFANNVIFAYGSSATGLAYGLAFTANQVTNFGYGSDVSYNQTGLFQVNQWYHLVVTYNGTTAIIYVNGVPVVSENKTWNTNAGSYFYLGSFLAGSENFHGIVDDLLIYNRALSATEVSQIYSCSSEKPSFTQVAPICAGAELAPLPIISDNGITGTWSPATMNNTATTTYTFTPTAGQNCTANTTTMTIAVHPANVVPTFSLPVNFCAGAVNPLPTVSDNGISGTWSPGWNPSTSATYTFTPTAGSCGTTKQVPVNIMLGTSPQPPTNTYPWQTNPIIICEGTNTPINIGSSSGSIGEWFTSSSSSTPIYIGYSFTTPTLHNTTTYYVRNIIQATGCMSGRYPVKVTVIPNNGTPTFTQITAKCVGQSFTLPTTSNNGVTGTWSPAVNTNATTTYTFTPTAGHQCGVTATATMTVTILDPNTTPTFTQVAPICAGTSFTLPSTSNNGIVGTWSPALNNNATTTYTFTPTAGQCNATTTTMTVSVMHHNQTPYFTQILAMCAGTSFTLPSTSNNGFVGTWSPAVNNNATTTYTFTPNAGQCGATTATMTVTIIPSGTTPTFTQVAPICQGYSFTLPTTSNNGISGTWSPAINTNETRTYTFTPSSMQCGMTTATMTVTVNPSNGTTPTFAITNSLCSGAPNPLPTVSENGIAGTWSPAWNPNAGGSYTFTADAGCSNPVTVNVSINTASTSPALPVNNTAAHNLTICAGNSTGLSVSASGTVQWFTSNSSPTVINTGTTLTTPVLNSTTTYYVRQYSGSCYTPRIAITVTVIPAGATPTFTQVTPICQGEALSALPTTSNNGVTGTWSPTLNNNTTTTYTFTPSAGQCTSGNATMTITVNPSAAPAFTQVAPICQGQSLTLPTTSNNGITGTWSPAVNNNATTTYTFTPNAGQCVSGANPTIEIVVNPSVTPTFTQVAPICQGETLATLPTTSNNGVTGMWSPALNNNATTTYTFTPSLGQCVSGGNPTMTINVNPVPQTNLDTLVCHGTTLTFGSHAISANGIYNDTLQTTLGCDSIVRLQVTYIAPIATTLNVQRCVGSSYVFDGQTLTTDGTHTAVFTSTAGCDSSVTLNLTFVSQITETVNATICNGNTYTLGAQQLNATGIYTETFQSVGGCDSIVTLNLTVTTINTSISVNGNTLTANQAGASYQWINCANNTPVSGATAQTFTPTVSGNYAVEITVNNCTETSACHTVNIVGIDEISMRAIAVYPNPATSYVTIDNLPENSTITVSDLTGKIIYQTTEISTSTQIQTSAFANGIYNIHINNPSFGGITKKLAISK